MEVILKSSVRSLGKKGDIVNVKEGYAQNFLFPRGLAEEVTKQTIFEMENKKQSELRHLEEKKVKAEEDKDKINGKTVHIEVKSGADGKMFGSVTSKDIAKKIEEEFGVEINKHKIDLPENIKSFGAHECTVKLHNDTIANIIIIVKEL